MLSVDKLRSIVEAALFASPTPLGREQLAALFDEDERPSSTTLRSVLSELQQHYAGRGVELVEIASGYRFQVPDGYGSWVSRLWEERAPRYSRALLETLALIAYRQPITRGEIEQVRGVAVSSNIIRTLEERGWIRVLGHRDVPGRPALFGTTRGFLDYFNLKSLNQLPTLSEIRDLDQIAQELEKQLGTAMPPIANDTDASGASDASTETAPTAGLATETPDSPDSGSNAADDNNAEPQTDADATPGSGSDAEHSPNPATAPETVLKLDPDTPAPGKPVEN